MTQVEMHILGEIRGLKMAPMELVKKCRDGLDAIRLCVHLSDLTQEAISERCGINTQLFSRIMNGRAAFPDRKRDRLMYVCGNRAPAQFDAWKTGCELVEISKDTRIKELEDQLARLKGAA